MNYNSPTMNRYNDRIGTREGQALYQAATRGRTLEYVINLQDEALSRMGWNWPNHRSRPSYGKAARKFLDFMGQTI